MKKNSFQWVSLLSKIVGIILLILCLLGGLAMYTFKLRSEKARELKATEALNNVYNSQVLGDQQ